MIARYMVEEHQSITRVAMKNTFLLMEGDRLMGGVDKKLLPYRPPGVDFGITIIVPDLMLNYRPNELKAFPSVNCQGIAILVLFLLSCSSWKTSLSFAFEFFLIYIVKYVHYSGRFYNILRNFKKYVSWAWENDLWGLGQVILQNSKIALVECVKHFSLPTYHGFVIY